jgi:tRNA-dihydrouridine synthase B
MNEDLKIGPLSLPGRVLLAPMSGITDAPFRKVCLNFGAGLAATEMTTANLGLWNSETSLRRRDFSGLEGIRVVQIAGGDPELMARAAREACAQGAQIIDINLGCPAKKVCRKYAGSALLRNEELVKRILTGVVDAVPIPVTVKMRTGWNPENRNGVTIARLAESVGVMSLAVHGRTRECGYKGEAEYETIRAIKSAVSIPVFANGDIKTPRMAADVLRETGADGVMIGRSAQGQPWLFEQMSRFLQEKVLVPAPSIVARRDIILAHLDTMYRFYGEHTGVRVARKHLTWYCRNITDAENFRRRVVRSPDSKEQMRLTNEFFDRRLGEPDTATIDTPTSGECRQWRRRNEKIRPPEKLSAQTGNPSQTSETGRSGT